MDEISVGQIHAGDGDGGNIIFDFNGQRIDLSVFPGAHNAALLNRVISCLE